MVQRESATVVGDVYNITRRPPLKATVRKTGLNAIQARQNAPLAKPKITTEPQDDEFIVPIDDDAPLLQRYELSFSQVVQLGERDD
jgi:hypothetical protein